MVTEEPKGDTTRQRVARQRDATAWRQREKRQATDDAAAPAPANQGDTILAEHARGDTTPSRYARPEKGDETTRQRVAPPKRGDHMAQEATGDTAATAFAKADNTILAEHTRDDTTPSRRARPEGRATPSSRKHLTDDSRTDGGAKTEGTTGKGKMTDDTVRSKAPLKSDTTSARQDDTAVAEQAAGTNPSATPERCDTAFFEPAMTTPRSAKADDTILAEHAAGETPLVSASRPEGSDTPSSDAHATVSLLRVSRNQGKQGSRKIPREGRCSPLWPSIPRQSKQRLRAPWE